MIALAKQLSGALAVSISDKLEDIERGVGAIMTFLEAGEYTYQDLRLQHESLKEYLGEVDDLRGSNEDWLENNDPDSRKHELISEQTGYLDDAVSDMGQAEDEFRAVLTAAKGRKPEKFPSVREVICCLARACDNLTEAMKVSL